MTSFGRKMIPLIGCVFLITGGKMEAALIDQAMGVIAEVVAAASASNTNPNVTVILHSPVVVPAMSMPDNMIIVNTSSMSPLEAAPPTAGTEAPVQNLAPEMFNSGFALVNGTPVFLHASASGERVMEKVPANPTAPPPLSVVATATQAVLSAQEAHDKDSASIAHSVMKAMENFNNISRHDAANNNSSSISKTGATLINNSAEAAPPTISNNTSSISVVVVPLIPNAFDLVDEKSPSVAQMAAKHPIIFTEQNGSHTIIHVVVKRELVVNASLIPIGEHNAHGPLTETDFLGGGFLSSNSSVSSSAVNNSGDISFNQSSIHSFNASSLRPLLNDHGPLHESDFNLTTPSSVGPLNTSRIVIVQPVEINTSFVKLNVSFGDLVTEHLPHLNNSSAMAHDTLFIKPSQVVPELLSSSILIPSALVPVRVQVVEDPVGRSSLGAQSAPIFFVNVNVPVEQVLAQRAVAVPATEIGVQINGSTTTSSVLSVNVPTLPSAPRVPLDIEEPVQSGRPVPVGTFAFLPLQDKNNATDLSFRIDV